MRSGWHEAFDVWVSRTWVRDVATYRSRMLSTSEHRIATLDRSTRRRLVRLGVRVP